MNKKLGVALGAGAAWGCASVGVLKVLEENKIKIDYLSGSSMGALVGAAYASQFAGVDTLKKIKETLEETRLSHGFGFNTNQTFGLFSTEKIIDKLQALIGDINFEDLKIPLTLVVTDFKTGGEVHLSKGPLLPAVAASCAIPLIFTPVEIEGRLLIDGGFCNPTPVDVVKKMGADITVGITFQKLSENNLDTSKKRWHQKLLQHIPPLNYLTSRNFGKAFGQVINLFFINLDKAKFKECPPDILISPNVQHRGVFDYKHAKEFISIGEKAAQEVLSKIKKLL